MAVERIAGYVEGNVFGQGDRQILPGNRHDAARGTVDHRDRTAPIALPGHAPVAQAEVHLALADPQTFHASRDLFLGLRYRQAVEKIRIDQAYVRILLVEEGLGSDAELIGRDAARGDHRHDGQAVLAGEVEIALVMRRAAEDGAFAVGQEHEIGGIDRKLHAGAERMAGLEAQEHTLLLGALDRLLAGAEGLALAPERGDRASLRESSRTSG